ncbi:EAL domain-containing protein [uncultured Azonexus sp.]|uniref:putative bifunctional diguanylate cyclase/phosphodiesterase n=1 Tax=uncultured Azonexus sp. TaxID=520307 RepID=UPI00260448E2|nr:EAL domain-containing protein [uncultured Azonexus sp.]
MGFRSNSSLLSQARILVVESDPGLRADLVRMLSPSVREVVQATDGDAGLNCWSRISPDVVIAGQSISGIDALEMSGKIRALDSDALIMLISTAADNDFLHRVIDLGIDAHLLLPLDHALMLDMLARCLRDRQRVLDLKMASMVFEVVNEGILITDDQARILAVNPAFSLLTGYRPDEVVGQRTSMLSSGLHPPEFYRTMWENLLTHGRWSGEITNRRKDGVLYDQWLSIAAVDGEIGMPRRFVGLVSDITERKREEERMRRLAHFDSLTGLPNRVLFLDRLQRSIARARRYRHKLALLYLDLDHFKLINDSWGHAAGDEVLRVSASRMVQALRMSDTVSRRGGDEFVLILEQGDTPECMDSICQKLLNEISREIPYGNALLRIDASIGVAIYPDDAEEADELLAAADVALYEAKAAGKGCFRFFHPWEMPRSHGRRDMEHALREGLTDWRYTLRYLPEVCLKTGRAEYVEALLRFQHPEFGLLDAGRFLEIAEEIGIMPELGRKALAQAAGELNDMGGDLGLVIDLSAKQLSAPDAVNHLLETLASAGVPTRRLTFECSEAALTGNERAVRTLLGLAESGCKFSLDDFGAGYCSFSLLSQLPMSSIKIDRSFTSEITVNPQMRELVAALVAFAQRLGVRAVAEGVETPEQLEVLRRIGCDAVQGYVFGKPLSFNEWRASSLVHKGILGAVG